MLTKRDAVWICRKVIKLYHPDLRGDDAGKKLYWNRFLDTLYSYGRIDKESRDTWLCPFK